MTHLITKTRGFILLAFLLLGFYDSYCGDMLDSVKSRSKLTNDLKDIYRAYKINHQIADQKGYISLATNDESRTDLNKRLVGYIKICEGFKQTHFFNDTLGINIGIYLTATIQNYRALKQGGLESASFKLDYKKYEKASNKYFSYLAKTYPLNRFVDMPEDKYWKANDKKNYIKWPEYAAYQKLKLTDQKAALAMLEKAVVQTTNFQERSVYKIELADEYVMRPDHWMNEPDEFALKTYKAVLDANKYSIYLFEAWVKWRAVKQHNTGLSTSSDIPNGEYDKVREQVTLTIVKHVVDNPKDDMAVNEVLLMATHDIIQRFGAYKYGNQGTIEFHELFDAKRK